jgi:hypothetical protein
MQADIDNGGWARDAGLGSEGRQREEAGKRGKQGTTVAVLRTNLDGEGVFLVELLLHPAHQEVHVPATMCCCVMLSLCYIMLSECCAMLSNCYPCTLA